MSRPDAEPAYYEIRVGAVLDACSSEWLGNLAASTSESGETMLSGPLADQAALHGVLARIRDLGVPLLSVQQVHPPP